MPSATAYCSAAVTTRCGIRRWPQRLRCILNPSLAIRAPLIGVLFWYRICLHGRPSHCHSKKLAACGTTTTQHDAVVLYHSAQLTSTRVMHCSNVSKYSLPKCMCITYIYQQWQPSHSASTNSTVTVQLSSQNGGRCDLHLPSNFHRNPYPGASYLPGLPTRTCVFVSISTARVMPSW